MGLILSMATAHAAARVMSQPSYKYLGSLVSDKGPVGKHDLQHCCPLVPLVSSDTFEIIAVPKVHSIFSCTHVLAALQMQFDLLLPDGAEVLYIAGETSVNKVLEALQDILGSIQDKELKLALHWKESSLEPLGDVVSAFPFVHLVMADFSSSVDWVATFHSDHIGVITCSTVPQKESMCRYLLIKTSEYSTVSSLLQLPHTFPQHAFVLVDDIGLRPRHMIDLGCAMPCKVMVQLHGPTQPSRFSSGYNRFFEITHSI